ncbi:MAG: hypothetical protein Q4E33_01670 [Erysipelotrichaceae bacterium]|nr:hypothetical protein [Erysipelotrichaceae bacterium]
MNKEKITYEKLLETLRTMEPDKRKEYLTNFFVTKNYKNYEIEKNSPIAYKLVMRYLFSSGIDIEKRAYKAIDKYYLCREAFVIVYMVADNAYAHACFKFLYSEKDQYPDFSEFERTAYLQTLDLFVDFAISIGNYTLAQKVENLMVVTTYPNSSNHIERLTYILYMKEDIDEMYRVYCEANDYSVTSYILLMLTLLKHDDELRTKEVLREFIDKYTYGKYLGRIWELDEREAEGAYFFDAVDSCYDKILSVPDFFATISEMTESIINI